MLAAVPPFVAILLAASGGYLLGSVTIANHVARRHGVSDLRQVGDHNPGYWNARQQLGNRAALPIFLVDTAKGAAAAAIGLILADSGQWWLAYLAGGAAMVGHAWPVFAGFRGGRSVLTFVGAAAVFAPLPALVAIGLFVTVWGLSRSLARGARAGVAAFPVCQILIEGPYRTALTGVLMTLIGLRFLQAQLGEAPSAEAAGTSHNR
jgi:glycerol-3-phosphate acyltransferase PlsY